MKSASHALNKSMSIEDIDKKVFPDYDRLISPEISRRKATFNAQRKRGRLDGKSEAALRILIRLTRIEMCKLYVSDHEQYKVLMSPQYNALPVEINMVEMAKIMNPDLNTPQYKWDSREVLAKSKSSYDFFAVLENPDLAFFIDVVREDSLPTCLVQPEPHEPDASKEFGDGERWLLRHT